MTGGALVGEEGKPSARGREDLEGGLAVVGETVGEAVTANGPTGLDDDKA